MSCAMAMKASAFQRLGSGPAVTEADGAFDMSGSA